MTELEEARAEIDRCDREMAALFARRMDAVTRIAAYKREQGLPVMDAEREQALLERNETYLPSDSYREEYRTFLTNVMTISRGYQARRNEALYVDLSTRGYAVTVEKGGLYRIGERFRLDRRCLIVTDDGVPSQYAHTVAAACAAPTLVCLPMGEGTKCLHAYERLLRILSECGFTRGDCVIAVGGGVVGDLAGFAAATYQRGIDFYNVPTTLLAQVDSSVGGKTGLDLENEKNQVGAFWQPRGVLIDPDTLSTLPRRQFSCGMAEVIKMALTSDESLLSFLETATVADAAAIIRRAVAIKRDVVTRDEREAGLRRILNLGHTVGHAVESLAAGRLLHGECVAIGLVPMVAPALRPRVEALLSRWGLPTALPYAPETLLPHILHDKKLERGEIVYVYVEQAGTYVLRRATPEAFCALLKGENA